MPVVPEEHTPHPGRYSPDETIRNQTFYGNMDAGACGILRIYPKCRVEQYFFRRQSLLSECLASLGKCITAMRRVRAALTYARPCQLDDSFTSGTLDPETYRLVALAWLAFTLISVAVFRMQ